MTAATTPFDPSALSYPATHRRQLVAADLLTGAEALARYAEHGTPAAVLNGAPDPARRMLRELLDLVAPTDLPGGAAWLWEAASQRWRDGTTSPLEDALPNVPSEHRREVEYALDFARHYGLGVAYQALPAARRLLALSAAFDRYAEARAAAASALETAEEALRGVA